MEEKKGSDVELNVNANEEMFVVDSPDPLKYMIAFGLHLSSWAVIIFLSVFPIPWFVGIWLVLGALLCFIACIFGGCVCCGCCEDNNSQKTNKAKQNNVETKVLVPKDAKQNGAEQEDDNITKCLNVFIKIEIMTGMSMMINFIVICVGVTSIPEMPYFGFFHSIVLSIPLPWQIGIVAFIITYGALVIYEGIVEIWNHKNTNKEDKFNQYQMIVFKLLLHSYLNQKQTDEKDKTTMTKAKKRLLNTIDKKKNGIIIHYALIAGVVAITFGLIVTQIEHAISDHQIVTIENIWIWCSIIFTNAYVGLKFVSKITIFMVENFVATNYYNCKCCNK